MNYQILLLSIILFPFIDYFYLSTMSSHFNNVVKNISGEPITFNYLKAFIAYIFLILGLNYFVLQNDKNIIPKLIDAFVLGLVIYGTYDFTNGAIFKEYDWQTSIIDTTWGGVLYTLTTLVIYLIDTIY